MHIFDILLTKSIDSWPTSSNNCSGDKMDSTYADPYNSRPGQSWTLQELLELGKKEKLENEEDLENLLLMAERILCYSDVQPIASIPAQIMRELKVR